jgi:hypothetical protein
MWVLHLVMLGILAGQMSRTKSMKQKMYACTHVVQAMRGMLEYSTMLWGAVGVRCCNV